MEHIAGLCLAGDAALVAIGNITLGNFLAGTLHKLKLDSILNFFDSHALGAVCTYAVGDFLYEGFVFAKLGGEHRLTDCRFDFLFVVSDHAAVALNYYLYHYC